MLGMTGAPVDVTGGDTSAFTIPVHTDVMLRREPRRRGRRSRRTGLAVCYARLLDGRNEHYRGRPGHCRTNRPLQAGIIETLRRAVEYHRSGRVIEAEALYREVLDQNPAIADARHLLGLVIGRRDLPGAMGLLRSAVALAPDAGLYLHNMARLARHLRPRNEELLTRRALAVEPEPAEAWHSLGALAFVDGRRELAFGAFRRAVVLDPAFPGPLFDLATEAIGRRMDAGALRLLQRVLAIDPRSSVTKLNIGSLLHRSGRSDEAVSVFSMLLAGAPDFAEAWGNRGVALSACNRFVEARRDLKRSLALAPATSDSWFNLGNAQKEDAPELETAYRSYRRAIALNPMSAPAHVNLAFVLFSQGRVGEMLVARRRLLVLLPGDAQAHYDFLPFMHLDPACSVEEQRKFRRIVHARFSNGYTRAAKPHRNRRDPRKRLRLGYIDNRMLARTTHSTNLLPTVEAHDLEAFELYMYTNLPAARADAMTSRYASRAAAWRWTEHLDDEAVAALVREDEVDILVDVSSHLTGARGGVLARKPAPIQVTMMQVGSSGMPAMDYAVVDETLLPAGCDAEFSEAAIRLPVGFLFVPLDDTPPPVQDSPALARGYVTFGSFNLLAKIGPGVVALWARVLSETPGSRLVVKAFGMACRATRSRFRREFAQHGIERQRLDLRPWEPGYDGHLQAYNDVDVVLDCFPYPGMTTSMEAMLMGVPVVTRTGNRFASRVGEAILTAVGHPELVAKNDEAYVALAVSLAENRDRLVALRRSMRASLLSSRLSDPRSFTRELEAALREAWRAWCGTAR
jgi:protein O-GlcNAc transferase